MNVHIRPVRMEEREGQEEGVVAPADQEDQGEREEPDGAQEEAGVRNLRDPAEPSREERARHELTHVPFRPWCRHCVEGKAADDPHFRGPDQHEEPEVVKASLDYGFLKLEEEEEPRTVLVLKVRPSGAVGAKCVTAKGREDPTAAAWIVHQLRRMGAGRCVLQADGEPAMRALVKDVIEEACVASELGIAGAHSPAHDHRANGMIERAVREVKDQVRVMHCALQHRVGKVPTNSALFDWLVPWAAEVLTGAQVGKDGMTAFRRVRGKDWTPQLASFGEQVMARRPRALAQAGLEPRWDLGTYLGTRWGTAEHFVANTNGTVHLTRSIRRVPEARRWEATIAQTVSGVPEEHGRLRGEPAAVQPAVAWPAEEPEAPPRRLVRGFHIRQDDMLRHGYTRNCPRCDAYRTGHLTGVPHSAACRLRFRELFEQGGDSRVDRARQRLGDLPAGPVGADPMEAEEPAGQEAGAAGGAAAGGAAAQGEAAQGAAEPDQQADAEMEPEAAAQVPGMALPPAPQGAEMAVDALAKDEETLVDVIIKGAAQPMTPLEETRRLYLIRGESDNDAGKKVSELFSPPRVNRELRKSPAGGGITAGTSFDMIMDTESGESWDFRLPQDRRRCWQRLEAEKPWLVIGSPPCTAFSALNIGLNFPKMDPKEAARRQAEGRMLLGFALAVYRWQLRRGCYFLHEHPASASSWALPEVRAIAQSPGVTTADCDACVFGMVTPDGRGGMGPAKKPTRWLSNAPKLLNELRVRCGGRHSSHVPLLSGRAAKAAVYPPEMVAAIVRGVQAQLEEDARLGQEGAMSMAEVTSPALRAIMEMSEEEKMKPVFDEYTGEELPPILVAAGKREELRFLATKNVWSVVPRPRLEAAKVIGTRWVCCNKGDSTNPEIRCRLVCQEVKKFGTDEYFAATPPIEAMRLIMSFAAESPDLVVTLLDISRAYFNADIGRTVHVELPGEAGFSKGFVALLHKCMYGTRDAAKGWEAKYCDVLLKLGFKRGSSSPCLFIHKSRNIRLCVHGDDFLSAASKADAKWFEQVLLNEMEGKLKGALQEPGDELRVLNRIVRRSEAGYEWEADQRHGEIITRELGLTEESKPLTVPGRKRTKAEQDGEHESLTPTEHSRFRTLVARANFMSSDRGDITFAVKELCRKMAQPDTEDMAALKRLGRYLKGHPRLVMHFPWQAPQPLTVLTDSDWAGCPRTRRSTSGGVVMRGCHVIKHYSTTQATVALSSAEAELISLVRGASEGLGIQSLLRDLGEECEINLMTDATAAMGICRRTGVGKVRHLDTRLLWIQDKVRGGDIRLEKIAGLENPADAFTKYLGSEALMGHMARMGCWPSEGRARTAPTTFE